MLQVGRSRLQLEAFALLYLAVPNAIFLWGWIVAPIGPLAACALLIATGWVAAARASATPRGLGVLWIPLVVVAGLWCVLGGQGHLVFANADWVVRDAVLRDLTLEPWPVVYRIDEVRTILRAPIAYFLPAALVGKLAGLRAVEMALGCWTALGVALVFALIVRDRPPLRVAMIRVAVFMAFSGMDLVGQAAHFKPWGLGEHLEWWAFLFQYSSHTTQLFWVPNHALPGWIAIAWLTSLDRRRLPVAPAILFVAMTPMWSPLTAIGLAPIVAVAIADALMRERTWARVREVFDLRVLCCAAICLVLIYPYITAGSDRVRSGLTAAVPWVGEDFLPRYVEFVLFEFAGFAVLLLRRDWRDPRVWTATVVLLLLPIVSFGPNNDLAMRASIAPLALLSIGLGRWLAAPGAARRDPGAVACALLLLAIGSATPFMEVARDFIRPAWPLDTKASVPDVTRGAHYLTPAAQPWLERFLRPAPSPSP